MEATLRYRSEFRKANPLSRPGRIFHLVAMVVLLGGSIAFALSRIVDPTWVELLVIPILILVGNLLIYLLHRYVLHIPLGRFNYGYEKHTLMHHQFFTDEVYGFESLLDLDVIFFPPWFVFFLSLILAPAIGYGVSRFASANAAYLTLLMVNVDYLSYEAVHYCSHLEAEAWVHRIPLLRFMRRVHRLHHRKSLMGKHDFDIVLPIFDAVFGTLHLED